MVQRVYPVFVVVFWLASSTWLVVEKVLPPLLGGTPPDYHSALEAQHPDPDYWKILWNDRAIGFAASHVYRHPGGVREMRNVVQIEDAPVDAMISEALGGWSKWTRSLIGAETGFQANLLVGTQIWFDALGHLSGFHSVLDLGSPSSQLWINGEVTPDGKLNVVAQMGDAAPIGAASGGTPLLRQTIELPPGVLVRDAFTPRGELKNLRIGQAWTIPVYRPFPPNSPVQIVAVRVERHEVIIWEGRDVETLMLAYRADAGSGLTASREPIATEWVRRDGVVLRQEVSLSGVRLRFERHPAETYDPRQKLLNPEQAPQLWGRGSRSGIAS